MKSFLRNAISLAILLASQALAQAGALKEHPGHWLGDVKLSDSRTMQIGVELLTRADGSAWASVSLPEQGRYDIAASIREAGDVLELDLPIAHLKLTWAGDHFDGQFRQGEGVSAFALQQVAAFPVRMRPQTPTAPFPYKDETLAIASTDGVTLGATLSVPNGKARPNVVVLVHGSTPGDRDESIVGHKPFAVLADYLARRGVAVLRYDKRGHARSTGDHRQLTATTLAADLHAVVQALKARPQFNRLGLIGHSEGSGIAAAVAAGHPESVDFVVSLAGIGMSGLDALLLQDAIEARDHGASAAEVAPIMAYVRQHYDIIVAQPEVGARIAALKALYAGLSPEDRALVEKYRMNEGSLALSNAEKPWLRALLMSNPALDWRIVRCPVLALNGSLDRQVPAEENLSGIVRALKSGGNRRFESAVLPSLNHMFQTAKTGKTEEYIHIAETMAPIAQRRIAAFVKKQR